jgi:septum formation protein
MTKVILASKSPRRTDLLAMLGVAHSAVPSRVDESPLPGEKPEEQVLRLARAKAEAVAAKSSGDALVIGSDTLVVIGGKTLGQPRDASEAKKMLAMLSGKTHVVLTGICLVRPGHKTAVGLSESRVTFHKMSKQEIAWYVATKEPLDKAGSYAAQGVGAIFLKSIEGSFHNVVGFPVDLFARLIEETGLTLPMLRGECRKRARRQDGKKVRR